MSPLEKASEAKRLLESQVFREVMSDIRNGLISRLEASAVGDVETHHEIALALQVAKQIERTLVSYADELAIDEAERRHKSWIAKARERLS